MSEENSPQASMEKTIDVVTVGNAIVDTLVKTNDEFLKSLGLKKGTMNLIDEEKADKLFALFDKVNKSSDSEIKEMSGGCAANLSAGISSFGGKSAFIGKVSDDQAGKRFTEKLTERGIGFSSKSMVAGGKTGRSLVIVTEDGVRTMCTFLGSSQAMSTDDIDEELIKQSKMIFLSGFIWDCEKGKETAIKAIETAKQNDCKIVFSLADASCVERHRDEFKKIMQEQADIVFTDKPELFALFDNYKLDEVVKSLCDMYKDKESIAVLTCLKDGATVISKAEPVNVPMPKIESITDTTGSGAMFSSGFLYATTHGFDNEKSATLGNLAAAEVLKTVGARPASKLKSLIAKI